jgi:acetyl esterase
MNIFEKMEPLTSAFLKKLEQLDGKPIYELSPTEARQVLLNIQTDNDSKETIDKEDKTIPVGPNGTTSVSIFRPKNSKDTLSTIMFFHGGGWVLGDKKTHERFITDLIHITKTAVVCVNYTPAPEAKYPTQIEEAYAATQYIYDHGHLFKLNTERLAIVGDSVGGNMAIVVALLAKERHGPTISSQVLFYPVTDANFETGSYQEFADGPWLTKKAMEWFWKNYLPDESKRKQPTASPLQATIDQLKGLPPTLITTNELDVLRDEGEALAHKLTAAGVPVISIRYAGSIHDSALLNPLADTLVAQHSIEIAADFLKKHIKQNVSEKKSQVPY